MDQKTEADQQHTQDKQSSGQSREALSRTITRLTGIRKKGQKVILLALSFLGFLATLSGVLIVETAIARQDIEAIKDQLGEIQGHLTALNRLIPKKESP